MRGSIPGPRDHDLSRRQTLNRLRHPGAPCLLLLLFILLGGTHIRQLEAGATLLGHPGYWSRVNMADNKIKGARAPVNPIKQSCYAS